MYNALLPLIALLLVFYLWQAALRAREHARMLGQALCQRSGVQLLDQSVALQRLGLIRGDGGWPRLFRRYRFEISVDGMDRHPGSLDIVAERLVAYSLPIVDAISQDSVPQQSAPPALR